MYLIFDTETSGLPLFDKAPDDAAQCRIVQLGALLLDEKFEEQASFCTLIKPTGWQITSGAYNAHHISIEDCEKYGVDIEAALEMFRQFFDKSAKRIAHNIKFDAFLLNIETAILGKIGMNFNFDHDAVCTMLTSTPVCKIPNTKRAGQLKWPKLSEAYEFMYHEVANGEKLHNALVDCKYCAKVFQWLVQHKHVTV